MRATIWTVLLGLVASTALLAEAHAWPASAGGAIPIAEASKNADTGDYFAISGVVVSSQDSRLFTVRDETGEMLVLIPEYVTREKGMPVRGERVRVSGKYDSKKLDTSVKGMRVSKLDRLGKWTGGKGSASPNETASRPSISDSGSSESLPAKPRASDYLRESNERTIQPKASRELVDRLRDKRIAFNKAKEEVDQAAEVYADALYAAGDGPVDPAILDRLQRAEAHMAEIGKGIPALVDEAREAGISDELISLYKRSAGMSY